MSATYRAIKEDDYAERFDDTHQFALDVLVGLSEQRKYLPSKYMYDDRGSELFSRIMDLDEYYPTDCEKEILNTGKEQIVEALGPEPFNLVELGAGDGKKTVILLEHLLKTGRDFSFVPIDISEGAMREIVQRVGEQFPDLRTDGLVSEYFVGLKWLNNINDRRNVVLFLGSSIGNFTHAQAQVFLRNAWTSLDPDDYMLIGFDLKKNLDLLIAAYNDSQGVTAEFNLNVLHRINRELGGRFDVNRFRHVGTYDVFSGAMESYLVSLESQEVMIGKVGRSFRFQPWEPIHMEYSYKYLVDDIESLAAKTGFRVVNHFFDSRRFFTLSLWRVEKPGVPA